MTESLASQCKHAARSLLRRATLLLVCLTGLQMAAASGAHANGRLVLALLPELPPGMTLADICGDMGIAGAEHPCPDCVAASPPPALAAIPSAPGNVHPAPLAPPPQAQSRPEALDFSRPPRAPPVA